jgi:hypothetical protein
MIETCHARQSLSIAAHREATIATQQLSPLGAAAIRYASGCQFVSGKRPRATARHEGAGACTGTYSLTWNFQRTPSDPRAWVRLGFW